MESRPSMKLFHYEIFGVSFLSQTNETVASMSSDPNSLIFDLCKHRNWLRVEMECNLEPVNASYNIGDDIRSLPLHIACKKQPTSRVIRSLLKAHPKATRTFDDNGYLPLHVACLSNASIEVLQTLSDNDPETASLFNASGESTLAILSRARDTTEIQVDFHNPALWKSESTKTQAINYSTLYWQKIQVLLEAIAIHRQSSTLQCVDDLFTLHAAVSLRWCPADVLHFCCHQFPEQVRMTDDSGRLPLHVVIRQTAYYKSNETLAGKLHLKEKSIIIPRLLHIHPEAAHCTDPDEPNGRFPLHTALINKHEWYGGVNELYQQHPEATLALDPVENLYPFQLASFDLDTAFQLLRNAPSALINSTVLSQIDMYEVPVFSTLNNQATSHSPPQRTPRQREKRRKQVETSLRAEFENFAFPTFDDEEHVSTRDKVLDFTYIIEARERNFVAKEDIYFSIDDVETDACNDKNVDVIWDPIPCGRRRQRNNMERIHSIQEIVVPEKPFHTSVRRGAKSSVVPPVIAATSEHCLDEAPILVEDTEHSVEISCEHSCGEELFREVKTHSTPYSETLRFVPSEQSVETRLMQNLNVEDLSTCSNTTMTNDSASSENTTYNKYKYLISGTVQKDEYTHEWSHDVVTNEVIKLYKQPTIDMINY